MRHDKAEYAKEYLKRNREALLEYKKDWYKANRDRCLVRAKEKYYVNKEPYLERARLWRASNKGKVLEFNRAWYKKNIEKARKYNREKFVSNYKNDPFFREKIKTRSRNFSKSRAIRSKAKGLKKCGCGCDEPMDRVGWGGKENRFLTGHKQRKHSLNVYGLLGRRVDGFFRRSMNVAPGEMSRDVVNLALVYQRAVAKTKGEMINMDAKILMREIKSDALKQVAESLNGVLSRIESEEIGAKEGMVEITAHKHIIQTIALDWTFNGVKRGVKEITNEMSVSA